jgi:alpha-tubulin suppressor-like RCC1 family protein
VRVLPSLRFRALSVGAVHACAIADDRAVHCWGDNSSGQLGDVEPRTGSVQVASTLGFADVSAGADHSCAIRTDGALFCWGNNNRGQLGTGTKQASSLPLRVSTNLRFASVSAGEGRTCARTLTGTVFCWGSVWLYREGGLEYSRDQAVPASVPGAGAMTAVSVGTFSTCATDAKGVIHCWEANPFGQLGNGTTEGSTTPLPVASDERFVSVSAGIIQTCAVAVSGIGYCWGNDSFGQLGVSPTTLAERCNNPTLSCSTRPIPVFGRQQFTSISTGFGNHSCGVSTKRNIYCWGLAWLGQLGGGMATYREVIPVLARPPLAMSTR